MTKTLCPLEAPIAVVLSSHQYRAERWPGMETGWRSLPDTLLEISYDGIWQVDYDGGSVKVEAGQVLVVPGGVGHCLRAITQAGMHSSWLSLHWEMAGLPLQLSGPVGVLDAPSAAILESLCAMLEEAVLLREKIRFQRLGLELLELLTERYDVRGIEDLRLARAIEYARAHYGEPVSRADMARAAGLSETRFHDLFREAMGEAPVQYLNGLRLRQAMFQLRYSDKPVGQVACACGFASDFYFSRFFKQKVGMSPRAFRQLYDAQL